MLSIARWQTPSGKVIASTAIERAIDLRATINNVSSALGSAGPDGPYDNRNPGTSAVGGTLVGRAALRSTAASIRFDMIPSGTLVRLPLAITVRVVSASGWTVPVATAPPVVEPSGVTTTVVDLGELYRVIAASDQAAGTASDHYSLELAAVMPGDLPFDTLFPLDVTPTEVRLPITWRFERSVPFITRLPDPPVRFFGREVDGDAAMLAATIGALSSLLLGFVLYARMHLGAGMPLAQRHLARYGRYMVLVETLPIEPFDVVVDVGTVHALARVARREHAVICVHSDTFVVRGKGGVFMAKLPPWAEPVPVVSEDRMKEPVDRSMSHVWEPDHGGSELVLDAEPVFTVPAGRISTPPAERIITLPITTLPITTLPITTLPITTSPITTSPSETVDA
jgi:hypothetical protein